MGYYSVTQGNATNEPSKHDAKQKKPVTKGQILCNFSLYVTYKEANPETESRLEVNMVWG